MVKSIHNTFIWILVNVRDMALQTFIKYLWMFQGYVGTLWKAATVCAQSAIFQTLISWPFLNIFLNNKESLSTGGLILNEDMQGYSLHMLKLSACTTEGNLLSIPTAALSCTGLAYPAEQEKEMGTDNWWVREMMGIFCMLNTCQTCSDYVLQKHA